MDFKKLAYLPQVLLSPAALRGSLLAVRFSPASSGLLCGSLLIYQTEEQVGPFLSTA